MDQSNKNSCKLILDCDPGTDDAHAILIALAHRDLVDLIAITTVVGNSTIENTTRNALRILKFSNRQDIPVYRGCSRSLVGRYTVNDAFHGQDGMGDVRIEGVDPVDESLVQKDSAPLAIVNLVNKHPGELTLLAVGPLTNVAAALLVDEELGKKLKHCVIMGGNLNGVGNISRSAEFNFFSDPEAAQKVLQSFGKELTLVPFDTCNEHSIPWDVYKKLTGLPNRTSKLLKEIDAYMVDLVTVKKLENWSAGFVAWDQMAMAVVLRPDCVLEEKIMTAAVELSGSLTRGQMVVGCPRARDNCQTVKNNVKVVTKLDLKIFLELLEATNSCDFC